MADETPGAETGESASPRRVAQAGGMQSSETKGSEATGACIEALVEELEALAAEDRGLESFLSALRRVDPRHDQSHRWERTERPALHPLGQALSDIPSGWKLGDAVSCVAPLLDWRQVFRSEEIDPHLQTSLTMASLAVRRGGPDSQSLFLGLFLLAPHTSYPLHSHTAPEVYYCVSGRLTLQHGIDGKPFPLPPGRVLDYAFRAPARLEDRRWPRPVDLRLAAGTEVGELVVGAETGRVVGAQRLAVAVRRSLGADRMRSGRCGYDAQRRQPVLRNGAGSRSQRSRLPRHRQ